jgi:hypothetical protein
MTVADDLVAAKGLIDTPEKWTKREFEMRGCLCALGAVAKAICVDPWDSWEDGSRAREAKNALDDACPGGISIIYFNDRESTTHADLMRVFDRAIEAERAKESSI